MKPAEPKNVLRKLRKARGLSEERVGEALNVSGMSISRYEREDARLTLPLMGRFAQFYTCTIGEIAGEPPPLDTISDDGYALLPRYDVRASAGSGAFFDVENIRDKLAFRRQWLRAVANAPIDQLAVLEADGDSMEPTLHDGDHMLVDRTQTNPRRDGIYVICWEGFINVKRVTTDPARKTITVASDNPNYTPSNGVRPDDIQVLGRVLWIGRRV